MEIILREAIDRLGGAGDVVKVKDGYARNFLLPQKKAYRATPGNLKVMEQEKTRMVRREAALRGEAQKLRELLSGVEIDIERRVGEHGVLYGSVTSADIAESIGTKGFTIDKRKILLDEHIKEIGEFRIPIRLFTEVTAEVTLRVVPEGDAAPVTGATSVAEDDATSVAEDDATSVAEDDATSVAEEEATSVAEEEATSVAEEEATSVAEEEATSVAEEEATSVAEDDATSVAEEEATSVAEDDADSPTETAAEDPEADEGASG